MTRTQLLLQKLATDIPISELSDKKKSNRSRKNSSVAPEAPETTETTPPKSKKSKKSATNPTNPTATDAPNPTNFRAKAVDWASKAKAWAKANPWVAGGIGVGTVALGGGAAYMLNKEAMYKQAISAEKVVRALKSRAHTLDSLDNQVEAAAGGWFKGQDALTQLRHNFAKKSFAQAHRVTQYRTPRVDISSIRMDSDTVRSADVGKYLNKSFPQTKAEREAIFSRAAAEPDGGTWFKRLLAQR